MKAARLILLAVAVLNFVIAAWVAAHGDSRPIALSGGLACFAFAGFLTVASGG